MNKDFKLFTEEFKKWQAKFGLNGWRAYYRYMPIDGLYARMSPNLISMTVSVDLNSRLPEESELFKDVKRSAKHEAIHLLLSRLEIYARNRYTNDTDITEAVEELVIKLEGLIK